MLEWSCAVTQWSARRWLGKLQAEIGEAGLSAAVANPGLAAMVDQHAAAVRDSVTLGSARPAGDVAVLAHYARGVLGHARAHGWQPLPAGDAGWRHADWTSLRLVAVCALARVTDDPALDLPPLDPPQMPCLD